MWSILKTLLVQGVLAKTFLRSFGWLAWLIPAGFLLKIVGIPLLIVMAILGAPVIILLLVIGLPIFVVLLFAALILGILGSVLTVGIAVAKIVIPIVLMVWFVRWFLERRTPDHAVPVDAQPVEPAATV